jgi:type II secretory ATPase GspE/PulE/Tfp pilus assembly ATPase PilB-like protein
MAARKNTQQPQAPWQMGPPVEFKPDGASQSEQQARLIGARQSPGFAVAGGQLAHALATRANQVLLDFTPAAMAMRYQVDGIWENLPPLDRPTGDAMLEALKTVAGMNPKERRAVQTALLSISQGRDKYEVAIHSQGVASGERVLLTLRPKKLPFQSIAALGMREKLVEQFRSQLNDVGGLILVSAPKGEGLTTSWQLTLETSDRFVRDFHSLEDRAAKEPETINVAPNYFDRNGELSPTEVLEKVLLRQPDVLVVPEIPDDPTSNVLVEQCINEQKTVITRIVAADAAEALARFLAKHRNSAQRYIQAMRCVTGQRLVRRLCEKCKQPFQPPAQLLQRLGIPANTVTVLYRQYVLPPPEQQVDERGRPVQMEPCAECGGRGFKGRMAIIEVLTVTPELRELLKTTGDPAKIRAAARQAGHKGIQEEGLMAVVRGQTTLEEIKRILQPAAPQS